MKRYTNIDEVDRAIERARRSGSPDSAETVRQLEGQRRALEARGRGSARKLDNHIKIVIGGMVLEALLAAPTQVDLDKLDAYFARYARAMRAARMPERLEPAEARAACRDFERRKRATPTRRQAAAAEPGEMTREAAERIAASAAAAVAEGLGEQAYEAALAAAERAVEMSAGCGRQAAGGADAGQGGPVEASESGQEPLEDDGAAGGGREDAGGAAGVQVLDNGGTVVGGVYIPPAP